MLTQLAQTKTADVPPVAGNGSAPSVALIAEERSPVRGIAWAVLLSLPVWMVLGAVLLLFR